MRGEAVVTCERDRIKPELAGHAFTAHMHMLRFRAIKTVEEETVLANDTLYCWHLLEFYC